MKKIFVLLSLAICVSVYASINLKPDTKTETIATNSPFDGDEFVAKVNGLYVFDDGTYEKYPHQIYKNKRVGYYVWINLEECPVCKNSLKTYKNVNVSSYKYYVARYGSRYFFNL
ncbi:MAG: hypothetical protein J6Y39_06500 [Bacteroidaceae bacterium]|nr:hypothetical protein [Bacteroidaceae bacterium]